MWELRNKVAIAGVGYSPLLRKTDRTLASLAQEAFDAAIADAGLSRDQIDGLATYPDMPRYGGEKGYVDGIDVVTTRYAATLLGLDFATNVTWSSEKGAIFRTVADAVQAVADGECTAALVWRAVHVPKGRFNDYQSRYAAGVSQFIAPYGYTMPAAWAAAGMMRYMHVTGCTRESFARLIVQNRENTNRNPRAYFYGTPLTIDDYMNARVVADPCTIYDCDIPVDGAAAIVLTSAERARDLRRPPALVTAVASSRHHDLHPMVTAAILDDMWDGSADMAQQLWDASGLGPGDIDVAELYDGFSIFVYTWLEGLGFCRRGEGFRFIDDGRAALSGEVPINTSGVSLGEGRLHGMAHIAEAAMQVMGRAGACQVPGAAHAVATFATGGRGSYAFLLSRDER